MNKTIFITTSIPYVNSKPHVGHAQEFVIADCIARLYRSHGCRVTFQTGTDENAFKNVEAARRAGVSVQEFVDRNAGIFKTLVKELNISADTFIRTTETRHHRGVEKFWSRLNPDDLYLRSYEGLYCVGCEDFLLEKDLINGFCADHKSAPETINEENIFFRLSRYQSVLEELIASDKIRIVPATRKNEVLSFIRQGLHDISLTRARSRSGGWGIPAPGCPDQVVYVWIDALINYLTGQGFGESSDWEDVWNEQTKKIHVIGKNVWKFHAVYWPALLLSADLTLPNEILVHGFLTNEGVKISKSLGNTIDPLELSADFGADAIRHFLLGCTPIFSDSDFSIDRLSKTYEGDLVNRLGNLYSRLVTLCEKSRFACGPFLSGSPSEEIASFAEYSLQEISQSVWKQIGVLNAEINQHRPWELLKREDQSDLWDLLKDWCLRLYRVARKLEPFIPESSARIRVGFENGVLNERILFPSRRLERRPKK